MSSHVLLNLLNKLKKSDKMRGSFFFATILRKDLGQFPIQSAKILTACG